MSIFSPREGTVQGQAVGISIYNPCKKQPSTVVVGEEGPTVVPSGRGDRGTGDGTHEFVTSLLTLRSPPARGEKNKIS